MLAGQGAGIKPQIAKSGDRMVLGWAHRAIKAVMVLTLLGVHGGTAGQLRMQHPGAVDHVMDRVDRGEGRRVRSGPGDSAAPFRLMVKEQFPTWCHSLHARPIPRFSLVGCASRQTDSNCIGL